MKDKSISNKHDSGEYNSDKILGTLFLRERPLYGGMLLEKAENAGQEEQFCEQILMCKNQKVYNITTEQVYQEKLLPGCMRKLPCQQSFRYWMKQRYSSGTNTLARRLRGMSFGQGNRELINDRTHALSFTDCYWIQNAKENLQFEEISPYYVHFWTGDKAYDGTPIPTLYVTGALDKEWRRDGSLYKQGKLSVELDCIELCRICGIPVEQGCRTDGGICLENFTSDQVMLEQMNESGMLDPEDFTAEDIVENFGIRGVQMLTIDAITGNGDRHAGNFGYLRDADSGEYLGMAPLYDFDHALDASATDRIDVLMEDVLRFAGEYGEEILRICECARRSSNEIFRGRAAYLELQARRSQDCTAK